MKLTIYIIITIIWQFFLLAAYGMYEAEKEAILDYNYGHDPHGHLHKGWRNTAWGYWLWYEGIFLFCSWFYWGVAWQ